MTKREWKDRYIIRLVEWGFTRIMAQKCYNASRDSHDYDDSPEVAADDEAYYWASKIFIK